MVTIMIFFSSVMIIELGDQDQMVASRCSWETRWRTGRRRGQGLKMLPASRALIFATIECITRALIFRRPYQKQGSVLWYGSEFLSSWVEDRAPFILCSDAHCTQMNIVRISYHAQLLRYCAYFRHTLHHNTGYFIQVKKTLKQLSLQIISFTYLDIMNTAILYHTSLMELLLPSSSSVSCSTSYFCLLTSIWPISSWEVAL